MHTELWVRPRIGITGLLYTEQHDVRLTIHRDCSATRNVSILRRQENRHPGQGHHGDDRVALPRVRSDVDDRGPESGCASPEVVTSAATRGGVCPGLCCHPERDFPAESDRVRCQQ